MVQHFAVVCYIHDRIWLRPPELLIFNPTPTACASQVIDPKQPNNKPDIQFIVVGEKKVHITLGR